MTYNLRFNLFLERSLLLVSVLVTFLMAVDSRCAVWAVNSHLFIYIGVIILHFMRTRRLNLFLTWIASFIFIILSEMMLIVSSGEQLHEYIRPFILFLLSNDILLLTYSFSRPARNTGPYSELRGNGSGILSLSIVLEVAYLIFMVPEAVASYLGGRQIGASMGTGTLIGTLIGSVGYLVPAAIFYCCKYVRHTNVLVPTLITLPVFLCMLALSTRFNFLFSVLPCFVIAIGVDFSGPLFRKLLPLFVMVLALGAISSYVRENRYASVSERGLTEHGQDESEDESSYASIAGRMSPEGCVEMARIANWYFDNHNLSYGKESAMMLYFWVPRSWWPNKPTMLDHWLIREYTDVGESHSTASGYIGELRADFGWLSLLFMVLFGFLLRKIDNFIEDVFSSGAKPYPIVLAALLFPYVFFFVRSPQTASFNFIFELVLYWLFLKIFCIKKNGTNDR